MLTKHAYVSMLLAALVLAAFAALLAVSFPAVYRISREAGGFYIMDASYAGLEAARADGALRRGWVPEGLPPSCTRLEERHSGDTNEMWAVFEWEDGGKLDPAHWKEVTAETVTFPRDPNRLHGEPPLDWWPESFPKDRYTFYSSRSPSARFFAAVDPERRTGYYWAS